MSSPIPTAKPRAGRLFGVGVTPRNAVMSANARVGVRSATKRRGATRGIRFIGRVYAKAPRFAGSRFGGSKIRTRKRDANAPMPIRAAHWLWPGRSGRGANPGTREPRTTIKSSPMDFRLSDDQDLLRRSVREFAEAEIRPHVMEWDE